MKVRIIKTGKEVDVYKHSERNVYVNSNDCATEYDKKDVQIVSK